MKYIKSLTLAFAFTSGAAFAQDDISFDASHTEACLASANNNDERSYCVKASARVCFEATSFGSTTAGSVQCMLKEHQWWEKTREEVAAGVQAFNQENDKYLDEVGSSAPRLAPVFAASEAAWQIYQSALCDFEVATYGGGSGASVASAACHLRFSSGRALYLMALMSGELSAE